MKAFDKENLGCFSLVVSVFALLVSGSSLVWQIWAYTATNKESVAILKCDVSSASWRDNHIDIKSDVLNNGPKNLYIKEVTLEWSQPMKNSKDLLTIRIPFQPAEAKELFIASNESRSYTISKLTDRDFIDMGDEWYDSFRVTVKSQSGKTYSDESVNQSVCAAMKYYRDQRRSSGQQGSNGTEGK